MKADKFNKIDTKVAWLRMNNLKPSSQHILYVEAVGEKATSLPSETLVAWTDPALPAFVDVSCLKLHCIWRTKQLFILAPHGTSR